tara:strand:+ start:4557 stop:4730 length:174 start_codon:yes stop_codon:yes gene_type:complete
LSLISTIQLSARKFIRVIIDQITAYKRIFIVLHLRKGYVSPKLKKGPLNWHMMDNTQ